MRKPLVLAALVVVLLAACGTSDSSEKGSEVEARQYAELFQKIVAKEGPGDALEAFPAKVSRSIRKEYYFYNFSYEDDAATLNEGLNIPSWLLLASPSYRRGNCNCDELPLASGCEVSLSVSKSGRTVTMICSTDPWFALG